ncbi:hypothetical protein O3P69_007120 [Scylla paramamosain]|uniref:Uncharacterized protein n=1 Tax=Scylla paramamosain TaxID=85552 RepID=A0AAW0V1D6_SCYPA
MKARELMFRKSMRISISHLPDSHEDEKNKLRKVQGSHGGKASGHAALQGFPGTDHHWKCYIAVMRVCTTPMKCVPGSLPDFRCYSIHKTVRTCIEGMMLAMSGTKSRRCTPHSLHGV